MKGKHVYTGFPGDCSEEQLQHLAQFRKIVTEMGLSDPPFDDPYLLRFLRARKFDIEKTTKMFKDYITWRTQNNVDRIKYDFLFQEIDDVLKHCPHGYHKTDKQGRPIYIERYGQLKLDQLFKITNEDRLMKYYVQSYEYLCNYIFPKCTEAAGHKVQQTLTILDLQGFSMKLMTKQVYNFIQLASKIAQDNYPEILGKMYIVNAPMLFTAVWTIVKVWLDSKTRDKINIIGSGFQKKLQEDVDLENLPEFLGGKCTCGDGHCLGKNPGPWNPNGEKIFGIEIKEENQTINDLQQQINNDIQKNEALQQEEFKQGENQLLQQQNQLKLEGNSNEQQQQQLSEQVEQLAITTDINNTNNNNGQQQ